MSIRRYLEEALETALGAGWWTGARVWGVILMAGLLLTPLLLANLVHFVFAGLSATLALAGGVVGSYAVGLPPWDADEPMSLPLVAAGAAASVFGWELLHGSASWWTLVVTLAVTIAAWVVRRRLALRRTL